MAHNQFAAEHLLVKHRYLFLLMGSVLLYIAFLGLRDVWYPGEPDMGAVALAMFNSGDWVTPRFMGDIWITYPPMMYWTANVFSHLLGEVVPFTLRLPNALSATVIVLMTCFFGSKWFGPKTGFWAGFAILISMTFVWQANGYRPDVLFALGISAGMFLYAEGETAGQSQWLKAAGFAFFGFAMLSKGILGLLLPGLVLVLWHGARLEWKQILILAPLSLVSLAVFMPWVVGVAQVMGWENVLEEFLRQNFGRYVSGSLGHEQPFWYYFRSFWLDLWPWSILFPASLVWIIRAGLLRDSRVQLLLWWFVTFFIFLTFAETKRALYLLPCYPGIALILGGWLATVGQPDDRSDTGQTVSGVAYLRFAMVFIGIVLGILAICSLLYPVLLNTLIADRNLRELEVIVAFGLRTPLALLGVVMITSSFFIIRYIVQDDVRNSLLFTGLSQVAILVVILMLVLPTFHHTKTFGPQSRWIKQQIGPEQTHIGLVYPAKGYLKRGGFGYEMGGTIVELLENKEQVEAFFSDYPESVVLVQVHSLDKILVEDESKGAFRALRTLNINDTSYTVLRAPEGN